jgi:hypothetical protein
MPPDHPTAGSKPCDELVIAPQEAGAAAGNSDTLPMLFCPVCDARLVSLRCKLLCRRCGYYMSCADYY